MYSRKQAYGVNVGTSLERDCALISFDRGMKPDEVKYNVALVILEMKNYSVVPDFKSTTTIHVTDTNENEVVDMKFTLSLKNSIQGDNMKKTVIIPFDDNFKDNLIEFLSTWFAGYVKTVMLMKNALEYTRAIAPLCDGVQIGFAYADVPVVAMTDNSIVLGLDEDTLFELGSSALFSDNETRKELYALSLKDKFAEFTAPWEVLQSKFILFRQLGVYSRVGIIKRLKKSFRADIRDEKKVNEVCKLDFGDCFALVKRINKADVTKDTKVAYENGDYAYEFVLTPFMQIENGSFTFVDEDNAKVLLETALTA